MDPEILNFIRDVLDPRRGQGLWGVGADQARAIQREPVRELSGYNAWKGGRDLVAQGHPIAGTLQQGVGQAGAVAPILGMAERLSAAQAADWLKAIFSPNKSVKDLRLGTRSTVGNRSALTRSQQSMDDAMARASGRGFPDGPYEGPPVAMYAEDMPPLPRTPDIPWDVRRGAPTLGPYRDQRVLAASDEEIQRLMDRVGVKASVARGRTAQPQGEAVRQLLERMGERRRSGTRAFEGGRRATDTESMNLLREAEAAARAGVRPPMRPAYTDVDPVTQLVRWLESQGK
jgi:hypothetical protein